MAAENIQSSSLTWLIFALMTVFSWGVYGVLLHTGQMAMGDAANGRIKAFLFVGVAYLLTAVIGSVIVLMLQGATWTFTTKGMAWSTLAGTAGALGALGVLLAFGAKGTPAVVMSIVFAGAPVVNAIVAMSLHPPAGGLGSLNWQFVLGIMMAAFGGFLVTLFRPGT
jgi:drug/metabolite transporter (DMT)-like permease